MFEMIFLTAFCFGLLMSVVSFFVGSFDGDGSADVSHGGHLDHGDLNHSADLSHDTHAGHHIGHTHVTDVIFGGGHHTTHADSADVPDDRSGSRAFWSQLNLSAISLFAAWFGGTGYILAHYFGVPLVVSLPIAVVVGLAGAAALNWFVRNVLIGRGRTLRQEPLNGVIAQVSATIRPGGLGEVIFTTGGTRQSLPARTAGAEPIVAGTEVVIVRAERGTALVEPLPALLEAERLSTES
ncbi:MAG TPA: NfeD family protein [Thermoanaerobaculia bacterium]